ncbi:response regulator [Pseudotabrizicola sp. L79]|uniref:response regulator n=1 Tax=Pseudotabrizicola sp. L79 TaxID=3118402 RepID=UPI002F94A44E
MRILAVDDDHVVLDLLRVVLEVANGADLCLFDTPMDALNVLNRRIAKYDCILLDISMPEMDGISLCEKIRSNPRYKDTPIIMLTAKSDISSIKAAFAAGATDFIQKPFEINALMARIRIANQLNASRNELRALQYRTKFERRKLSDWQTGTLNPIALRPNGVHLAPDHAAPKTSAKDSQGKSVSHLTRTGLVKLFSQDLSELSEHHLHRVRKRS